MLSTGLNTKDFRDKSDPTSRSSHVKAFAIHLHGPKGKRELAYKARPCEGAAYRYNPEGNFVPRG